MVHSENSKMINDYIELYQKGAITLEGLWYNIQTPLHILFQKEERLQVQEKRNQEQEKRIQEQHRDIVIWNTEYKQKEAALAHFVQFGNSLKEEIIELKKQLDYWYVEKVGYEKKESDLKAEIIELKKQLDALKKEGRNGWFWWS
jgi:chromosome segregation ATPase